VIFAPSSRIEENGHIIDGCLTALVMNMLDENGTILWLSHAMLLLMYFVRSIQVFDLSTMADVKDRELQG
jgi:hypothetical protein